MAIALCQTLRPSLPSLAQGRGTITANSAQISPNSSRILRRTGLRLSGHEFCRPSAASRKFRVPRGRSQYTAEWLDSKARVEVGVPLDTAWRLWEDREQIPQFMPWIASVKIDAADSTLSRWTLRWEAFGQNLEFSWLSRNLRPTFHQKIHWRSIDGLPNRGAVRFISRGQDACSVELTISYEVPAILAPFAAGLSPIVENIISSDLKRFESYAKEQSLATKA